MERSRLVMGEGSSPDDLGLLILLVGGNWNVSSKLRSSMTLLGLLPPHLAGSSRANILKINPRKLNYYFSFLHVAQWNVFQGFVSL